LEENLEKLKNSSGETAEFHAYTAAAYGFKIGLSTWRAPFFGPKSMEHAEKALAKNSQSFQANMEMGNIWNHMPAVFGGSDEKALKYYSKALEIIENEPAGIQQNNWMYLNLLTLAGQMHQDMKNQQQAKKYFEQALQIEPGFVWVKEELLPSLKTN
jgi:tetratricopeptide (TPR) repeat protein